MEVLGGKFAYRTSLAFHRRLILIPWVLRSRGICSASDKTTNPSFPVRYTPKTLKKAGKPQNRIIPVNGLDKNVVIKGLDPKALRCEVLNKMMALENSPALDIKQQNHYQGHVNELPSGFYQADDEIDYNEGSTEDELEDNAEELKIQQDRFPLSHDLQACDVKNDTENEATKSLTTSDKASDSSKPNRHFSKNSIKVENGQTRPMSVKWSEVNAIKNNVNHDIAKIKVENDRMASKNSFSDKELQNLNQGPASDLTSFRQETKKEIMYNEETSDNEYMEEPEDNTKELGIHPGNYSLSQAEKVVIKLLASRAYTAVELRKKLNAKRFFTSTIDAVIMDFQSRGLINDCFYAESYARSRWSSSSWGPRRVKQALRNKGVAEVDANEALKLVYEDDDEDSSLGLSKASLDQLYTQASKQWLRSRDVSDETRKSRMIRWLQYRGFNWGVTSFILKKLESKLPL